MKTTVSEKGQVTIPKPLRERLGIKAGQILEFTEEEGRLVAVKINREDPVDAVYGILDLEAPSDEIVSRLRGDVDTL